MALAFDRSASFAFDKAAGVPCPNLRGTKCRVHSALEASGCAGCARYDCAGAGQRVCEEVFAGRSWRDDASLVEPMMHAFRVMREVQELRVLLRALDAHLAARMSEGELAELERSGFFERARAAFQSLGKAEKASGASRPMNGSFGGIRKRCS